MLTQVYARSIFSQRRGLAAWEAKPLGPSSDEGGQQWWSPPTVSTFHGYICRLADHRYECVSKKDQSWREGNNLLYAYYCGPRDSWIPLKTGQYISIPYVKFNISNPDFEICPINTSNEAFSRKHCSTTTFGDLSYPNKPEFIHICEWKSINEFVTRFGNLWNSFTTSRAIKYANTNKSQSSNTVTDHDWKKKPCGRIRIFRRRNKLYVFIKSLCPIYVDVSLLLRHFHVCL